MILFIATNVWFKKVMILIIDNKTKECMICFLTFVYKKFFTMTLIKIYLAVSKIVCTFVQDLNHKQSMDVKSIIKEKGWTIERLATEIPNRNGEKGVSPITLHQNLSRNPTIDTLRKIAGVIGCKVGDFFRDEMTEEEESGFVCPKCGARLQLVADDGEASGTVRNCHRKQDTQKKTRLQKGLATKFLNGWLGDISKYSKTELENFYIALDSVLEGTEENATAQDEDANR